MGRRRGYAWVGMKHTGIFAEATSIYWTFIKYTSRSKGSLGPLLELPWSYGCVDGKCCCTLDAFIHALCNCTVPFSIPTMMRPFSTMFPFRSVAMANYLFFPTKKRMNSIISTSQSFASQLLTKREAMT